MSRAPNLAAQNHSLGSRRKLGCACGGRRAAGTRARAAAQPACSSSHSLARAPRAAGLACFGSRRPRCLLFFLLSFLSFCLFVSAWLCFWLAARRGGGFTVRSERTCAQPGAGCRRCARRRAAVAHLLNAHALCACGCRLVVSLFWWQCVSCYSFPVRWSSVSYIIV